VASSSSRLFQATEPISRCTYKQVKSKKLKTGDKNTDYFKLVKHNQNDQNVRRLCTFHISTSIRGLHQKTGWEHAVSRKRSYAWLHLIAVLIPIHGLFSFLADVYSFFNPSSNWSYDFLELHGRWVEIRCVLLTCMHDDFLEKLVIFRRAFIRSQHASRLTEHNKSVGQTSFMGSCGKAHLKLTMFYNAVQMHCSRRKL